MNACLISEASEGGDCGLNADLALEQCAITANEREVQPPTVKGKDDQDKYGGGEG